MANLLDQCETHGGFDCDCRAVLVAMGCMDWEIEGRLAVDPGAGGQLAESIRSRAAGRTPERAPQP